MRISDWSSDVCSSDLAATGHTIVLTGAAWDRESDVSRALLDLRDRHKAQPWLKNLIGGTSLEEYFGLLRHAAGRSAERRVGKERGSTGSSRWSPNTYKNKHT